MVANTVAGQVWLFAGTALVGACIGLAALERSYAPAPRAVVASASEGRMRAAFVIDAGR